MTFRKRRQTADLLFLDPLILTCAQLTMLVDWCAFLSIGKCRRCLRRCHSSLARRNQFLLVSTENLLENPDGVEAPHQCPLGTAACYLLVMLTCAPLMTSSHSEGSSIFVRVDESRCDVLKALIIGPEDTPYANGCFTFDIFLPAQYVESRCDYNTAPPFGRGKEEEKIIKIGRGGHRHDYLSMPGCYFSTMLMSAQH